MKVIIRFTEFFEEAPGAIRLFGVPGDDGWEGWALQSKRLLESEDVPSGWGLVLESLPPSNLSPRRMILLSACVNSREEWEQWLLENVEYIDFGGHRFYERSLGTKFVGRVRDWRREDN